MGNLPMKDVHTLEETIHSLIYTYIASLNFNDLIDLSSKANTKILILKIAELLSSLTSDQIKFLLEKKKIAFSMESFDAMYADTTTKKICIKLAEFYVQIISLFSSITLTLIVHPTNELTKLPLNNLEKQIKRDVLAGNRLSILLNNKNIKEFQEKYHNGKLTLTSDLCNFNKKCMENYEEQDSSIIPELEPHYFDKYDYKSGVFSSMSSKMQKKYKTDLAEFYKTLTGKTLPATITKFKEISLNDYLDCSKPIQHSTDSNSFSQYINNINLLLELITKYNTALLTILKEIFIYQKKSESTYSTAVTITINPELTYDYLINLTKQSIACIQEFYMYCDIFYAKGVKLYMDIVNLQLLDTSVHQIENLKSMANHISMQQCADAFT
jgi:hypothetical protein